MSRLRDSLNDLLVNIFNHITTLEGVTLKKMGIKVFENDYVKYQEYVRHDETILAKDIIELIISEKMTLEQRRELTYTLQRERSEN